MNPTGSDTSYANPLAISITLFMGLLIVVLPRRWAFLPVTVLTCYMPMGMRIAVLDLHFPMIRILLLFGWVRLLLRGELKSVNFNSIDKLIVWWTLSAIVTYTVLWGSYDGFKYELGQAYNGIGFYFLFRFLLKDLDEVVRVIRITALLVAPLAASMLVEKLTGTNVFSILFGQQFASVRDGVVRCAGPFAHAILAGTFGATLLPLFVGLWWQRGAQRLIALIGIISSMIIIVTSGSSGPVMSFLAAGLALAMWPLHKRMRTVRWGIVLLLIVLQIVMKAPIWFLVGRASVYNASDGYHRAFLIDRTIAHFFDWWLIGTRSTATWGYEMADVTNQYIRQGVNGGFVTMILFVAIIVYCFRRIGLSVRAAEVGASLKPYRLLWALGAALFAHAVTFISVSYFDQNFVNWYLLLAMIGTSTGWFLERKMAPAPAIATPEGLAPIRGFARTSGFARPS